jgi:uncharacterized protein (TIGR00266 family)
MQFALEGNPDFGHVSFMLGPNEKVLVESGAMAHMSANLNVSSRVMGGFMKALVRKLVAGESLLIGEYSSPDGGILSISPAMPGTVFHHKLTGSNPIFMQAGSFLACTEGVDIATRFGGLRAIFSGEGLFFLYLTGAGDFFYNAYGAIVEKEVDGTFIVDTGHVVGWEPSLSWKIRGMGSVFSTLFSGEGLVIEFTGKGKLLLQTRSFGGFTGWLSGYCR